ncbi:hypothetical protein HK101_008127 [Irineochytrium annulatum]|nr:hypothetical protein HK101_008127 [Irineochytrium annulatum]
MEKRDLSSSESEEEEWAEVDAALVAEDMTPSDNKETPEGVTIVVPTAAASRQANALYRVYLRVVPIRVRKKLKTGVTAEDRKARRMLHRFHLCCLVYSARVRNEWCNDATLQALALSVMPEKLLKKMKPKRQRNAKASRVALTAFYQFWTSFFVTHVSTLKAVIASGPEDIVSYISTLELKPEPDDEPEGETSVTLCLLIYAVSFLSPRVGRWDWTRDCTVLRFWPELFLEADEEWIPCNLNRVNGELGQGLQSLVPQQILCYVLAFDAKMGAFEVTRRYSTQWSGRTVKLRLQGDDELFWSQFVWLVSSVGKSDRDRKEEVEAKKKELVEPMPTNLAGFKNHAIYALERHCGWNQIIYPSGRQYSIGNFKGELVYPRSHLRELNTKEYWTRNGRQIKDGEEPVRHAKARATTVRKKREEEEARQNEDCVEGAQNKPLYGDWQTEDYQPCVLQNGRIPKNSFGNFELLHHKMLPIGAVHLRGTFLEEIAKSLGVDYAKAVVGFKFTNGMAYPTIDGIIVHEDMADVFKESKEMMEAKHQRKIVEATAEAALMNWKKLIMKVVTRAQLLEKYST